MPVSTRSAAKLAVASKQRRTVDADRVWHISHLDSDSLANIMIAFVNDEPSDGAAQVKKMATLRGVCKNFAEFFAKRLYEKTAAVMFTELTHRDEQDDEDALDKACAINMNIMAHTMLRLMVATCPPAPCFVALRVVKRFADAPNALERRKLLCMGMGVSPESVERDSVPGGLLNQ